MRPQSFRFTVFALCALLGTALSLQAQAQMVPRAPQIEAKGYLLMDAASGEPLALIEGTVLIPTSGDNDPQGFLVGSPPRPVG